MAGPAELVALYAGPDSLPRVLEAAARHLAAAVEGFAYLVPAGGPAEVPEGWAGFACAQEAEATARRLAALARRALEEGRPLRAGPPEAPPRVAARAAGGVVALPVALDGPPLACAVVGLPGPWPRARAAAIEAILRQTALLLDHARLVRAAAGAGAPKPGEEEEPEHLLELGERLLEQDLERMRIREELERTARFREEILEQLACELRSPVHEMVERCIAVMASEHASLSEAARAALREAVEQGSAYLRSLRTLVDLWRVRQGELALEPREFGLEELLEEALFDFADRTPAGVELVRHVEEAAPRVRGDLARLAQVVALLVDNALKFTPRGRVEVAAGVRGDALVLAVRDTGIGLAPEDCARAFEDFYQVDPQATGGFPGFGLGLPLARALVERMGGTIELASELGRGTEALVRIPGAARS